MERVTVLKATLKAKYNIQKNIREERNQHNKLYKFFFAVQDSVYFQTVILIAIVANTILLGLDRYNVSVEEL